MMLLDSIKITTLVWGILYGLISLSIVVIGSWIALRVKVGNIETRVEKNEENIKEEKQDRKILTKRTNNIAQGLKVVETKVGLNTTEN